MAKCWFCKTTKGKRYCPPIENLLCPICCGKNRLNKIECNENCRYLDGVAFQKKRDEEKEFSALLPNVPHGQFDDILQDSGVALVAGEIETFVRKVYLSDNTNLTDKTVYESYKHVYILYFSGKPPVEHPSDCFFHELERFYLDRRRHWELKTKSGNIGRIFLRLMISIKKMSGGQFGEFGYLNYLKNNFGGFDLDGSFIVEDKFGNKTVPTL
jgi:hypothetical protein